MTRSTGANAQEAFWEGFLLLLPKPMDRRGELFEFWRQPAPEGNAPEGYIAATHRSQALVRLIADVPKDARILEVGCNVGRNLAYLHDQGWRRVSGVEISPHAVELLRTTYPQLADCTIHLGAAEEVLPTLRDSYDLVFTMAVMEHIHPDSVGVFDDIARLGRTVLAIEPVLGHSSHRQYPHNVERLFKSRGFTLTDSRSMEDVSETAADPAMRGYFAWRFENGLP